jgi:hypothetical protein
MGSISSQWRHNKAQKYLSDGHSRHRSRFNFVVNLLAGLVAYSYHPTKPALYLKMTKASKPYLRTFSSVELTVIEFLLNPLGNGDGLFQNLSVLIGLSLKI